LPYTNFGDESACLMADNVRNEVVTIHRSLVMLKMLSLYTQVSFAINYFVKKTRVQHSFLHLQHTGHQLWLDGARLRGLDVILWTPVAIILRIYVSLKVKPHFIRK
jgi:hypothetical protein